MEDIRDLLEGVKRGEVPVEEALLKLKTKPFEDIGFAKVDLHRKVRQGAAEVIYGAGKTAEQIISIAKTMQEHGQQTILITRMDEEKAKIVRNSLYERSRTILSKEDCSEGNTGKASEEGCSDDDMDDPRGKTEFLYSREARCAIIGPIPKASGNGKIVVATGGTSDIPVAEEAALTAIALGNEVVRLYDVGVAGLHRTLAHIDEIMSASVIIAIAGMEGALASVIGGLADCPVIAVPTSVGYGASFHGLSALLSMLNSCASGVSVVNIDNGFGAGYMANMINHPKNMVKN